MLLQNNSQPLQLSVIDLGPNIILKAQYQEIAYELQTPVDQLVNAYEIQNAIDHKNIQILSHNQQTLKLKFAFSTLELFAVPKPYQQSFFGKNYVPNQEERIQSLQMQNLYLRTEVDQLTQRMKEMEEKMQKMMKKIEESEK